MRLVYVVKPAEVNESLRYSLRSVRRHLPQAQVTFIGHKPAWVQGVDHFEVPQRRVDQSNVPRLIRIFANASVYDDWVLMNDDFFALTPDPAIECNYSGTLNALTRQPGWRAGWYSRALMVTRKVLTGWGVENPVAFDRVHRPMPINNAELVDVLDRVGTNDILIKSLYGNMCSAPVWSDVNTKVYGLLDTLPETDWVSVNRTSWDGRAGGQLKKMFPQPCRFEV